MRSRNVRDHQVARRVAMASMSVLAASGIGLVAAPMAFGQIVIPIGGPLLGGPLLGSSQGASVSNSGSASANSGGNNAVGNGTSSTQTVAAPAAGAVAGPVSLG